MPAKTPAAIRAPATEHLGERGRSQVGRGSGRRQPTHPQPPLRCSGRINSGADGYVEGKDSGYRGDHDITHARPPALIRVKRTASE
jgi:hypothetical protein